MRRYSLGFIIGFSLFALALAFAAFASFSAEISLDDCRTLGLPVLTIETEGAKKIKSKEKYLKASYVLFDGAENPYGNAKIRGRGNTTWRTRELYKKPYLLKLNQETPLLDLPAAQKWVLMANTADKTELRNAYATHLATAVWNHFAWTPQFRFLSLFVNGKYEGLYALTEKIEAAAGRIPLDEADGSFLAEVNSRQNKDWNFRSNQGVPFSIRTNLAANEARFSAQQAIIQQAENVLFSADFTSPEHGYRSVLNVDSFVDWYLINELTKNHDARFQSSCYLTYDSRTKKISMGPIWDFDISCGNINWDDCEKPEGFWIKDAAWFRRLFEDEQFVTLVRARWLGKRTALQDSLAWVRQYALAIRPAMQYNDAVWKNIGHRQWPHAPRWNLRKTYDDEVQYLTDWLEKRMAWLDTALLDL